MNPSEAPTAPDEEIVRVFWQIAREKVGWGSLEALLGQRDISSVPPPAAALAETADEATRVAQAIRDGEITELRVPADEYADPSDYPKRGDLLIVCDGRGIPLALTWTSSVTEEDGFVVESFITQYPPQGSAEQTN